MELTTLAYVLMLALGMLGFDTAMHAGSIVVDVTSTGEIGEAKMDPGLVASVVDGEIRRIISTKSVVADPEIIMSHDKGVAMALAEIAKVRPVAEALQSQFGYQPIILKIDAFTEAGTPKIMVSGSNHGHTGDFEDLIVARPQETVTHLIRRAVTAGLSRIDPYTTALYLMRQHAGSGDAPGDGDFSEPESLAEHVKSLLPPTPRNASRSMFDNLEGVIWLFRDNATEARNAFAAAVESDPDNLVAALNMGFIEVQLDQYDAAAKRMAALIDAHPNGDPIVLSVAYATWAVACIGLKDDTKSDELFDMATKIDPKRAPAFELWSKSKRRRGDIEAAETLHRYALEVSGDYTNYAEVAVLYFYLAAEDGQAITRNDFRPPALVSFR